MILPFSEYKNTQQHKKESTVYQRLYEYRNLSRIDMEEYVTELTLKILHNYDVLEEKISTQFDVKNMSPGYANKAEDDEVVKLEPLGFLIKPISLSKLQYLLDSISV